MDLQVHHLVKLHHLIMDLQAPKEKVSIVRESSKEAWNPLGLFW